MSKERRTRREVHYNKKQKRRGGKWRIVLASLLILVGLALFAVEPIKNQMIRQGTETNTVGNITREDIVQNQQADVTYDWNDISTLNAATVIGDNLSGVNAEELPVVGGIAIPAVGMNLPIHLGVSNVGMYLGAGTLYPEQKMGESNYPLASHHSVHDDLLFAPLLRVEYGDVIYLTDLENIYAYEIDRIETVPPTAVEVAEPIPEGEIPIVTLITCDYDLIDRVIVQGTLIDTVPINEASEEVLDAFEIPTTEAGLG